MIKKLSILVVSGLLFSCSNSTINSNEQSEVSVDVERLTIDDYKSMLVKEMNNSPALSRLQSNEVLIDLNDLSNLEENADVYVPDFDSPDFSEEELVKIEKETGKDRSYIAAHADEIKEQYLAKKRYALFQGVVKHLKDEKTFNASRTAYFSYADYGLSQDEFWVLFWNPTCIDGTKNASNDAYAFEKEYYGSNGWLTKGDAFRHSIWNVLIAKYNAHEFNYKSEAAAFAKKFTDAHETGNSKSANPLDDKMDYHNNSVGRKYFVETSVNRGKVSWWGYDSRWVETLPVTTIKPAIFSKSQTAVILSSSTNLSSLSSQLVYVQ